MTLSTTKPIPETNQSLYLRVKYDAKALEVDEVTEASIYIGRNKVLDITECLASFFNLDEVIDSIDWCEIAAQHEEIEFEND